jgi:mevalonate kinase
VKPVFQIRSNGKLLLTGEYFVLKGARALALPLRVGQELTVNAEMEKEGLLTWESGFLDQQFLNMVLRISDFEILKSTNPLISSKLVKILGVARILNPSFLVGRDSFRVKSHADFKSDWGFGSSSTLISNIAAWAGVDPFKLNQLTFNGSGYDVACSSAQSPIFYQLLNELPVIHQASFNPPFREQLYFVYLGKKQDTRESLVLIKEKLNKAAHKTLNRISSISLELVDSENISLFETLLREHDLLVSELLDIKPVYESHFADFPGYVKSLGAWGGDFALVCRSGSEASTREYFSSHGYQTLFTYEELIRNN